MNAADPPTLHLTTRTAWRAWLKKHHAEASEIWVVFTKKHTGRRQMSYADAVEEALCFGWIDTTVQTLDGARYQQRFTPRRNTRKWSSINLERFRRMVKAGLMTDAGRAVRPARVPPPPERHASGAPVPAVFRRGLAAAPAAAREFWGTLAPGYRRDYIRWVIEAKQPATQQRRLKEAMRRLAAKWKRRLSPRMKAPPMQIRLATEDDAPRIFEMFDEVIAEGESYDFENDPERSRMRELWFPSYGRTYVAAEDGRVIGAVVVRKNTMVSDPSICNAIFIVAKSARNRGVGAELGEFAVEEGRRLGYREMRFNLVVSTNTSAVRLWKRLGFEIIETLPGAFPHPRLGPVDAFVMRRSLEVG